MLMSCEEEANFGAEMHMLSSAKWTILAFRMLTKCLTFYHHPRWCSMLINICTGSSIPKYLPAAVHPISDEFDTSFHISTEG